MRLYGEESACRFPMLMTKSKGPVRCGTSSMPLPWRLVRSRLPWPRMMYTILASGRGPGSSPCLPRGKLRLGPPGSSGTGRSGNKPLDFRSESLHDISPELPLFPLVFFEQTTLLIFCYIIPPHPLDLVGDVEENLFGATVAIGTVGGGVPNVAACDIGGTVNGEGDAVGHLLTPSCTHVSIVISRTQTLRPTFGIQPRLIPRLLASIDVNPSLLMLRVYLRPDVVLCVPYPSCSSVHSPAHHGETIGPFPASTSS